MDTSAQTDLGRGLADLDSENRRLIGNPDPKNMQLARGLLFFACDPRTNALYNTPWIRSPHASHRDSHFTVITEFETAAQRRYPNIDVSAINTPPNAVSGVIARVPNQAPIFFGIGGLVPDEHTIAIERTQSDLAEAGSLLHVQLGRTLLLAGNIPESSVPAQMEDVY